MSLGFVVSGAGQCGFAEIFTRCLWFGDFLSWLWRGSADDIMSPEVYFFKFSVKLIAVIAII